MKRVTIELDWDTVDNIVGEQLKETLSNLENDLMLRETSDKVELAQIVFEYDKEADCKMLREHVDAFKVVLSYFGHTA